MDRQNKTNLVNNSAEMTTIGKSKTIIISIAVVEDKGRIGRRPAIRPQETSTGDHLSKPTNRVTTRPHLKTNTTQLTTHL